MTVVSGRATGAADAFAPVREFFETRQLWMADRPDVCDFTFGNPHEMPLPGLVAALRRSVEPKGPDWFAYKTSEAEPRSVIADSLRLTAGGLTRPRTSKNCCTAARPEAVGPCTG